jgi:hypothetical protein
MKKGILIGIIIVVAVLAVIAYFALAVPAPSDAVLYIERGDVQVNMGGQWTPGTDEMELGQGDSVKTGDGEATVVILEGEMIRLEPNSEIKLEKIGKSISIKQLAGETLNKVTRLSGMTDYSVQTASTMASVRGTEFLLSDDDVAVTEGDVDYTHDKDLLNVGAGKQAKWKLGTVEDIDAAKLERLKKFRQKQIDVLKRVRMRELEKNRILLKLAEAKGMDETGLRQELTAIDAGEKNETALLENAPSIVRNKLHRAFLLTQKIKEIQAGR